MLKDRKCIDSHLQENFIITRICNITVVRNELNKENKRKRERQTERERQRQRERKKERK